MVRRPVDKPANALLDITIASAPEPLARFKAGCQPFPEQADDTTPGHDGADRDAGDGWRDDQRACGIDA